MPEAFTQMVHCSTIIEKRKKLNLMKKISDWHLGRMYYKKYENEIYDWHEFINLLINNGYSISHIILKDSMADVGMAAGGGTYSLQEYLRNYEELEQCCDVLTISLDYRSTMISVSNYLYLSTSDPDLEIDDILSRKNDVNQ